MCTPTDHAMLSHVLQYALVGSKNTVSEQLAQFVEKTEVDELIVSMPIHNVDARLTSVSLLAEIMH